MSIDIYIHGEFFYRHRYEPPAEGYIAETEDWKDEVMVREIIAKSFVDEFMRTHVSKIYLSGHIQLYLVFESKVNSIINKKQVA